MALTEAARRVRAVYAQRAETIPKARYTYFDAAYLQLAQERERALVRLFARAGLTPLAGRDILEIGCGSGYWLRELIKLGARPERLFGVDLLPDSLAHARVLCAQKVRLACADAAHLPFGDGCFDLVLQATVFSSIVEPEVRRRVAAELQRVLRPGGAIVWYDARVPSPGNRDFVGISARELRALFPGCAIDRQTVTLAPQLARLVAPRAPLVCALLARMPFLRTHYLALIRTPIAR